MNLKNIIKELESNLKHEGYYSNFLNNRKIWIGKGTLGPEMSWVAKNLSYFLLLNPKIYKDKKVLDIFAGSGIQGIITHNFASSVTSADISPWAIKSMKKNKEEINLNRMEIIQSNLYEKIKGIYDVIIANHPFIKGIPKDMVEGNYIIEEEKIKEFFKETIKHMHNNTKLIMPYSHFCDHNPKKFLGKILKIEEEVEIKNKYGNHSIYIIKLISS